MTSAAARKRSGRSQAEGGRLGAAAPRRRRVAAAPPPGEDVSSPDRVVQAIIEALRAGRYGPGYRLIEADLTRQLKVSRGSVREALKRLAAEGVVELRPNRGACITAFGRAAVHDMLVVTETLTGLAARLAAARIHEGENAERMRAAHQRLAAFRGGGGTVAFFEERRRFYDALVEIGGNKTIARTLPSIQLHLVRMQFQSFVMPRDWERQFADYEAITKAVLAGDGRLAERLTRIHIRRSRISFDRLPDAAFAPGEIG